MIRLQQESDCQTESIPQNIYYTNTKTLSTKKKKHTLKLSFLVLFVNSVMWLKWPSFLLGCLLCTVKRRFCPCSPPVDHHVSLCFDFVFFALPFSLGFVSHFCPSSSRFLPLKSCFFFPSIIVTSKPDFQLGLLYKIVFEVCMINRNGP